MAYQKLKFSKAALLALPKPPEGSRAYYSDTKEPGLVFMITGTGAQSFQLYMKHAGRPVRVTLGRFSSSLAESVELPRDCSRSELLANNPDLSVKMAQTLAAGLKIDIKLGINPTDVKKTKREELTVGQLFEEYVERHLIPLKRRVDSARSYFELYIGALPDRAPAPGKQKRKKLPGGVNWQNRKISTITTDDIQRLITGLATKGGSLNNANRVLTLLKSMFERARDWKIYKGDNPTDGISKYPTKTRERFMQADELPRLFLSLDLEANPDIRDYVMLSLLTGARKSNIVGMRWEDLNLDRAEWTIPDEFTKNGDPLVLPLMQDAVDLLQSRKPKQAAIYVFPGTGKSGHIVNARSGWDRTLDRDEVIQLAKRIEETGESFPYSFTDPEAEGYADLGVLLKRARARAAEFKVDTNGARLKDLRPHDMRRTLGSWQASAGASLPMIGRSLGHRSQAATAIYARLNIDPVRQSMNTATSNMLAAAGVIKGASVTKITPKKSA